ncbi:molybdenum cofactor guanylyltransferase [Alteribacillus sp. JSM 102045]|uniref:molybdenum cofactor guanylyltransferase n=1 Tax=Alteribacillus sp. JSM 102045 TaxID=1562101 RepID=UPI0035C029A0
MNIIGIVLAGGQSSRYGKPKMFEQYNGLSFYEHSIHAFKAGGIDNIYILTNNQLAPYFNKDKASILVEDKMHQGPLYALYFTFQSVPHYIDWVFVLPADTPFVSSAFVASALTQSEESFASFDAFIPVNGNKQQPLHGIYHRNCLPVIKDLLNKNKKNMYSFIQSISACFLTYPVDQKDFLNVNRKEDWPS